MWAYYAVLFLSSACIMTVELVAGRLVAPYVGVSLYAWTGIIAAVLAGMSGGHLMGGWLADRLGPRRLLGGSLVGSALLAVAMLPGAGLVMGLISPAWPPVVSIFLPGLVLFGLPCAALAIISPAVYKAAVRDLNRLGGTVGRLAASGILGSIIGTYATGFYLIPALGVRAIVLTVAGVLLLMGATVLFRMAPHDAEGGVAPSSTGADVISAADPVLISDATSNAAMDATPDAAADAAAAVPDPHGWSLRSVLMVYFLSSAAIMAVEVAGGRLLAPSVGTNLYTWTSVIGAVLLGMTLGGLVGGFLADRSVPAITLGRALAWAGAICGVIVLAGPGVLVNWLPNPLPPLFGIGLPTMALLLPPSLLLGAVGPLCYKLAVADTAHVGRTAGALGAAGALGSIAGTLSAGYWLVPTYGTLATVFGVSLVLAVVAAGILLRHRTVSPLPALMAIVLVLQASVQPDLLRTPYCQVESAYFCIRVEERLRSATSDPIRTLVLDHLIHSGFNVNRPDELWYEYEQVASWLLQAWNRPDLKALFLGGGGYLLPYWVEKHLPAAVIDVAEIDPEVTRIALRDFVPAARRIRTFPGDARMVLATLPQEQRYDVIFGDAFNDVSVPYHLTTREFGRMVRERLAPDGLYVVNIVDAKDGAFLGAYAHTLAQVFPYVYVIPGLRDALTVDYSTFIVVGAGAAVPWAEWQAQLAPPFDLPLLPVPDRYPVLTDDHAPVDNLLLPVFNLRWQR